jgi:hypothetical protein
MQTLSDHHLDSLFRSALAADAEALSLAAASESEMLERVRQVLTRRRSRRQLMTLLAAAALVTLTAGAIALAGDRLRPSPGPSESADPSQSGAPSASPIPVAGPGGVWIPVGTMGTPRADPATVRLLDGRVLVVGGSGSEFDPATAELYDPASGTWSATGSMLAPGDGLPPTLLLDGRVLAGDQVDGHYGQGDFYGHELYDPAIGTWTATGRMVGDAWTFGDTPAVLRDGRVLTLGQGGGAQVYDPASGTWTATPPRNNKDKGVRGVPIVLSDGKVLVAGGYDFTLGGDPSFAFTDVAEVYDPATGSWTEVAKMQEPDLGLMATLLPDGRALVVTRYGAWEIYDPAAGAWTAVPRPSGFNRPSAVLSDGTVLMTESDESCTAAALYDARTESLTTASSMPRCAEGSSFTLLLDGTVLMTGGRDCNSDGVCVSNATAALYVPAGMPLPSLPAFPDPLPPTFPSPTPVPTPLPPAAGPVPPDARSWTITVENRSSDPAALFVADDALRLVGSATPNVVPAGATIEVTFLFPAGGGGWIYVNPVPGESGGLVNADDIGIPGKILIMQDGRAGWLSP